MWFLVKNIIFYHFSFSFFGLKMLPFSFQILKLNSSLVKMSMNISAGICSLSPYSPVCWETSLQQLYLSLFSSVQYFGKNLRIRIRIVYWWNAETTIIYQNLCLGNYSLALTREVNLATQSSTSSADEIRESGRAFQSLIVWGKKLPL